MYVCEACGRQTPIAKKSALGAKPICEPCHEHYAEPPRHLALLVRYCRTEKRNILPRVKRRITCYAGEGEYLRLPEYYKRLTHQQLIIRDEEATCDRLIAMMKRTNQQIEDSKPFTVVQRLRRKKIIRTPYKGAKSACRIIANNF